jgi:hypothetical protein
MKGILNCLSTTHTPFSSSPQSLYLYNKHNNMSLSTLLLQQSNHTNPTHYLGIDFKWKEGMTDSVKHQIKSLFHLSFENIEFVHCVTNDPGDIIKIKWRYLAPSDNTYYVISRLAENYVFQLTKKALMQVQDEIRKDLKLSSTDFELLYIVTKNIS